MVAIAQQLHYQKIALAFATTSARRPSSSPPSRRLKKPDDAHHRPGAHLTATTFRTEAEAIVQSHPDAIMTEALGSADPTLFSEIEQLNGGKMIPVIGRRGHLAAFLQGRRGRPVGASTFASVFHADNLVTETSGRRSRRSPPRSSPSRQGPGATGNFTTYLSAPGGVHLYDGINLAALAMIMSKSTGPQRHGADRSRSPTARPARRSATPSRPAPHGQRGKAIRYEDLAARPTRQLPRLDRHLPD